MHCTNLLTGSYSQKIYQNRRKASPNRTQGHKGGDIRRECASTPDIVCYTSPVSCRPTVGHTEC